VSDPVVFMGSKAAGLSLCEAVCGLLPGRLSAILCPEDTGDPRSVLPAFRALAERHDVPLELVATRDATLRCLDRYRARVALVHGWYQIIPVSIPCMFYGFHYSPLPRYRGNAPLVWQIINGEQSIGVSLFRFSEGMDEGPIVGQATASLGPDETIADALDKANALALALTRDHLTALVSGVAQLYPQPEEEPSYCGQRHPEDGRIDWRGSAKRVHDFIRAQTHPYPGAYTYLNDEVLRVWRSSVEPRRFYGVPGSVVEVSRSWVVVACGEGAVRLLVVQREGCSESVAPEVLRSLKVRLG
jgi:methionyl-tRNA formyltransferase